MNTYSEFASLRNLIKTAPRKCVIWAIPFDLVDWRKYVKCVKCGKKERVNKNSLCDIWQLCKLHARERLRK